MSYVEREWGNLQVLGRSGYVLKEKLRQLKDSLRRSNNDNFGRINLEIDEGIKSINEAGL